MIIDMIKERDPQRPVPRGFMGLCLLAAILFLLNGCAARSVFVGSGVSGASELQMAYSILDQEETAVLELKAGDRMQVVLSHTEGYVDVSIGMKGKDLIYRGNGQQNARFILEITETGSYRVSVMGHRAKGNVSFSRISGEQE